MPKIFISYRRDDSETITGRIYDRLKAKFGDGNVFLDITGIHAAEKFPARISKAIAESDIMLVIIGSTWLNIRSINLDGSEGGRRLDDPNDFVRREVEAGLQRDDMKIIPILVQGASIPAKEQLPLPMHGLTDWQTLPIRSGIDFENDITHLIEEIGPPPASPGRKFPWIAAAVAVLALVAIALVVFVLSGTLSAPRLSPTPDDYTQFFGFEEDDLECWAVRWDTETEAYFDTTLALDAAVFSGGRQSLRLDTTLTESGDSSIFHTQIERPSETCGALTTRPASELRAISARIYLPEGAPRALQAEFFVQSEEWTWYASQPPVDLSPDEWVELTWDTGSPVFGTWPSVHTFGVEIKSSEPYSGPIYIDDIVIR